MKRPLVVLAGVLLGGVALWLALPGEVERARGSDRARAQVSPAGFGAPPGVDGEIHAKDGAGRLAGASAQADAERLGEVQAAEAVANRQRLVSRNLAALSAAAEQAEREGKAEYAAALRRRAESLQVQNSMTIPTREGVDRSPAASSR